MLLVFYILDGLHFFLQMTMSTRILKQPRKVQQRPKATAESVNVCGDIHLSDASDRTQEAARMRVSLT